MECSTIHSSWPFLLSVHVDYLGMTIMLLILTTANFLPFVYTFPLIFIIIFLIPTHHLLGYLQQVFHLGEAGLGVFCFQLFQIESQTLAWVGHQQLSSICASHITGIISMYPHTWLIYTDNTSLTFCLDSNCDPSNICFPVAGITSVALQI